MHFGFSYVGLIFLIMLFVPNVIWTKFQPKDYDRYVKNENKVLLILERTGEILVCCLVLIFSDFNVRGCSFWNLWLAGALAAMLLYEAFWIRYFRSGKRNVSSGYRHYGIEAYAERAFADSAGAGRLNDVCVGRRME